MGGAPTVLNMIINAPAAERKALPGPVRVMTGGAPTVLNMIINAPAAERKALPGPVRVMTGGAPPSPRVLLAIEELRFVIYHVYGLTETYGPATVSTWIPEWDVLPAKERAQLKARQGFHHIAMQDVDVKNSSTMESVPYDGQTVDEVMFRGNTVMSGYYKDIGASARRRNPWPAGGCTAGTSPCASAPP
ncbi:hypothetical protein ABZP36_019740 [Zizania latifolia]